MNILAADVKLVVIVRRDCQRHGPHETVFQFARRRAIALVRPNLDVASLARRQVEAFDDAADTPRTRSAGPDDVVINRIGRSPTAFTAADRLPGAARNLSDTAAKPTAPRVARPAIRWVVLLVAIDEIGNAIVDGDVVHLRDGKLN